jgi:hypothetical protein
MATANQGTTTARKTTARRNKPGPKPKDQANGDAAAPAVPKPPRFKYDLKGSVTIAASGEQGTVRARAEWATGNVSYFVAYTSKAGEYREAWIDEDLLAAFVDRRRKAARA